MVRKSEEKQVVTKPAPFNGVGEIILSGTGRYNDNGTMTTVTAGDVTYTAPGEGHGIECISDEPIEMIALILYE